MEVSSEIEYLMRGMCDPDDIVRLIVGMYASYDLKLTSSTRLVEPADTKCPMPFIFQKD
jgi:hypothetical protein